MKQYAFLISAILSVGSASAGIITSPSGGLQVTVNAVQDKCGAVTMDLAAGDIPLMRGITLGLNTTKRSFQQLRLVKEKPMKDVHSQYTMLQGKRLQIYTSSNDCRYTFVNAANDTLVLQVRLSNDGVAFRYVVPTAKSDEKVIGEATAYPVANGVKRWVASYDIGYEQFYPLATNGNDLRNGQDGNWGYPALFEPADGKFVLITESDILPNHCGSWINNKENKEVYRLQYADKEQPMADTWTSPWRLLIAGGLNTIVESTMVTDVAMPSVTKDIDWIKPAPVSWIYWAYNHGSRELKLIKQYIDHAVTMQWLYMLIDAEWDEMTNGDTIEEALEYAHARGVKPMLWYNSCTGWIDGPGPRWKLNKPEDRRKEFAWLRDHGVAGVKIDFFGGDNILNMNYYHDILRDALDYNLLVVLHGAVIPRGWQRTYPNLMTMEGVYGAEWYNNNGVLTNRAAAHNATLPFTRNVVGPMDYTPGTFSDSQHKHITSHGHELALYFLFESALQHMPDRPESYAALPTEVKGLLSSLPTVWDETRFLDGYPAHHVVMARRSGDKWYVAGINGTDEPLTLNVDVTKITSFESQVTLFADGAGQYDFNITHTEVLPAGQTLEVKCLPRGGFVAVIEGLDASTVYCPFGNALVPDMIADASIVQEGDWFYCYATTDGYGRHLETSGPPVVWKSRDFKHWQFEGSYFPSAVGQKYWAPSKTVKARNGKWYIYPTITHYMYPAVADSPEGPFRLARGEDVFRLPFTKGGTLLQTSDPGGIDAEVFIDDDGQAYVYWGRFYAGKLAVDMTTVSDVRQFDTPHHVYSEGPIFFKRNGVYYYLYTLGGDESYQYAYMMSRVSPLGPWEAPKEDIITTTNHSTGVFGPGHGCVFNDKGTDNWYFAFLEFGRRSTNRQTYVNKMEFNADGTIRPVKVDLKGVGALRDVKHATPLHIDSIWASSIHRPMQVKHNKDVKCQRTECFAPQLAIDASNGSRWMSDGDDRTPQLTIDLGGVKKVKESELFFVRPTAGHTYRLECSSDGKTWQQCGGQTESKMKSPCTDKVNAKARYLRVTILSGELGVWEWNVY